MKTPTRRRSTSFFLPVLIGLMGLATAVSVAPSHSANLSKLGLNKAIVANDNLKPTNREAGRFPFSKWISTPSFQPMTGETVDVLAADCVTPKSTFNPGETVCARTNGIDLTVANNYYMNWIDSHANQTNGGTITQNPQYFLFVPPTSGGWKATVGRVNPADSSIIGNPPVFTVNTTGPALSTYASNCTTPKTTFVLNETVCAKVSGVDPAFNRRFSWIDPADNVRQRTQVTTDPQTDTFMLPLSPIDPVYLNDNRGVWKVNIISARGSAVLSALFRVVGPTPTADLSVGKSKIAGDVKAGNPVSFGISLYNSGPSDAQNVVLTDNTPQNATFFSVAQDSGPDFTCTGSSTVTCSIAVLRAGESAAFTLTYTAGSAGQTITNTASVSTDTSDPNTDNNSATDGPYTIGAGGGGGGGTCSLACSDDISTPANTHQDPNDPNSPAGAIVHFAPPSANDECGAITVDHCNDCFFPQGDTIVTATSASGDSCSFTVTVTPAGSSPTISCPGNKTGNADGTCSATFNLGTATASGQNVTVVAYRSDGQPVYTCDEFGNCTRNSSDAPFTVGQTTVTWYAYAHDIAGPYSAQTGDEESHRNGSAVCTQTVTVNDVTPPTIAATDQTVAADSTCQAAVPDYSNTVSDNCACSASDTSEDCKNHNDIGYSQTPAAGTMVGLGPHTIHIEANDGTNTATKDITLTVTDQTAPTITCPANQTVNTEPGTCAAHVVTGTATATDNCDSTPTITGTRSDGRPLTDTYPKGTTTITWRATDDAGNYSECAQTITVEDHEAPTIVCPAPIVQGNDPGMCSATVNPGQPTANDNCDSPTVTGTRSDGQPLNAPYPKGTTTITWRATDNSGNYSECTQTVTVNDTEAPTFTFTAMQTMWPPNHKYRTFTTADLVASVTDNCDGNIPVSSVVITKVTSDEIENGNGDGNTLHDIVIAGDCKSVQLRAEREGNSNGRVYTIFFSVTDAAGNTGTGTTTVVVPHNPGETAVDSGPHYTVTSNCP